MQVSIAGGAESVIGHDEGEAAEDAFDASALDVPLPSEALTTTAVTAGTTDA